MARNNPYAVDPNLVQGFNNLTRALIGSSGTDKDMSAVRANDALAGERNQRAKNLALEYGIIGDQNKAVTNTSASEPFQNAIAQLITGQSLFTPQDAQMTDEYFEAGEAMDASNLGIESPADVATPLGQYRQGDPALSDLARTFFGDLKYTPNQLSSAFGNMGTTNQENARNNELVDIILNGTPKEAERAMMAYRGDGEFNLPGYAEQKNQAKLASDETQNEYKVDQEVLASKYQDDLRYSKGGSEDRLQAIRNSWERYKVDVEDKRKKYDIDEDNKVAVKKFEKEQEIIKYKHDNRTIEIQVGKDGRAYIDPITAQKMTQEGKAPNFDERTGLYYLDGQKSPEKIQKIEVGDKDVWMSAETAKIFGVEKNAEGKFIIKGKPKDSKSGGSSGSSGSKSTGVKLQESSIAKYDGRITNMENWDEIPEKVRGNYQEMFETDLTKELGGDNPRGNEARLTDLYIAQRLKGVSRATVKDGVLRNTYVYYPTALLEFDGLNVDGLVDMGYSKPEAEAIMSQVN